MIFLRGVFFYINYFIYVFYFLYRGGYVFFKNKYLSVNVFINRVVYVSDEFIWKSNGLKFKCMNMFMVVIYQVLVFFGFVDWLDSFIDKVKVIV